MALSKVFRAFGNLGLSVTGGRNNLIALSPQDSVTSLLLPTSTLKTKPLSIPERPKQPLSPFFAFSKDKRDEVKRQNPGASVQETAKHLATRWNHLSEEAKKPYVEKYEKDAERFKAEKALWWKNLTKKQQSEYEEAVHESKQLKLRRELKKQLRLSGKPKRPLSAFSFYVSVQSAKRSSSMPVTEYLRHLSHSWKTMTSGDKDPYLEMALNDRKRYREEMASWEKKMTREGHADLLGAHGAVHMKDSTKKGRSQKM